MLVGSLSSCGQAEHHPEPSARAGAAGSATVAGASGAGGATGGAGGNQAAGGIWLGGAPSIAGEATGATGGVYVAQPLDDTVLCDNNAFERVDELPDKELSFTATFDGEPVEVHESADVENLPIVGVFRFGRLHIEAMSFVFAFPGYDGSLWVSAASCSVGGSLSRREGDQLTGFFTVKSATFSSLTSSVNGFAGLTQGSFHSEWSSEPTNAGQPIEQHVFDATFVLDASMPDARGALQ